MKTKIVQNAIFGMGIGFPVTLLCMTLVGGFHEVIAEFLVWMVASALYGILSGVMFTPKNEMPLPVMLGLHCLGCLLITVAAALICGYARDIHSLFPILIPFAVVYVLVFILCVCMMKREEKQINQALEEQ